MVLGFHPWVYCQLELRRQTPPDIRAAVRSLVEEQFMGICRDVAAAGFEAIETMVDMLQHPDGLARHEEALGAAGLVFLGVSHNGAFWDPTQRSALVDLLGRTAALMGPLGGRHLGLSATPVPGRAKTAQDWDEQAETWRGIVAATRPHGVTPNLHTYARDAEDDFREVRELLHRLGPDEFALGPDLAWLAWGGGDPVEFVRRFGDRIGFCHVRNRHAAQEWAEGLGEGIDDQGAILAALHQAGCDGPVVFEPAFPDWAPTRPLADTWRRSAEHLRAQLPA